MFEQEERLQENKTELPNEDPTESHLVRAFDVGYEVCLDFQGVEYQVSQTEDFRNNDTNYKNSIQK